MSEINQLVSPEAFPEPTLDQASATIVNFPDLAARDYRAHVVNRKTFRDFETTRTGATIYSELLEFNDTQDRKTVRELTVAVPNTNLVESSPVPIVETDPWVTGEGGFNRDKIKAYADLGFTVLWLHHGGRYSPIQKDKSVSRSAHQMHAMLDDVRDSLDVSVDEVIWNGYSRGAMTGEKAISLAPLYKREVPYSDLDAPCFVEDMSPKEKVESAIRQIPSEVMGIGRIAARLGMRAVTTNDRGILFDYLHTLDIHPRNLIQEAMWAKALVRASVGQAVATLPEDTVGVRNFYKGDIMSQQRKYELLYKNLPGIHVTSERGPHVAGVYTEILQKKYARLNRVKEFIFANGGSLYGVDAHAVAEEAAQPRPKLTVVTA
jgi:hypothetical protein